MKNKNLNIGQMRRQKVESILLLLKNYIDNSAVIRGETYYDERTAKGLIQESYQANTVKVEPITKRFHGHIGHFGDKVFFWGWLKREYLDGCLTCTNECSEINLVHYSDKLSFKEQPLGTIQTKKKLVKCAMTNATEITVFSPKWREDNLVDVVTRKQYINEELNLGKVKICCTEEEYQQGADIVIDRIYNLLTKIKKKEATTIKKLNKLNLTSKIHLDHSRTNLKHNGRKPYLKNLDCGYEK